MTQYERKRQERIRRAEIERALDIRIELDVANKQALRNNVGTNAIEDAEQAMRDFIQRAFQNSAEEQAYRDAHNTRLHREYKL